jgi:hypothetical protein
MERRNEAYAPVPDRRRKATNPAGRVSERVAKDSHPQPGDSQAELTNLIAAAEKVCGEETSRNHMASQASISGKSFALPD